MAEKGISLPLVQIDLNALEHKDSAFSQINSHQRVPVLELDDGTMIGESVAICRYFEELHPDPPLFGTGAKGKAIVEMWNRRLELYFLGPVAQVFRHLHPAMATMEVPQIPQWGEANKARAMEFLTLLDMHLALNRFAAGDVFSIADITGGIGVDFMKPARLHVPESFSNVLRWHSEVAARPSWQA